MSGMHKQTLAETSLKSARDVPRFDGFDPSKRCGVGKMVP
jgi:hypothetical protein